MNDQENIQPWETQNTQVNTDGLPCQPLQVCHLEGTEGEQPLVVMMAHAGRNTAYRWQKAAAKPVPGGEALYIWQDCIARPDSVNYLISGEELHAGDAYRCIQYQDGVPVSVEYHQVRWEDELKYRPLVHNAFYESTVREEGLQNALKQSEQVSAGTAAGGTADPAADGTGPEMGQSLGKAGSCCRGAVGQSSGTDRGQRA